MMSVVGQVGRTLSFLECLLVAAEVQGARGIPRVEYQYQCPYRTVSSLGPPRDISSSSLDHPKRGRWLGAEGVQAKSWQSRVEKLAAARWAGLGPGPGTKTWHFHVYHGTRGYFHSGEMQEWENPILLVNRTHPLHQSEERKK
jgi:hypothetical protein